MDPVFLGSRTWQAIQNHNSINVKLAGLSAALRKAIHFMDDRKSELERASQKVAFQDQIVEVLASIGLSIVVPGLLLGTADMSAVAASWIIWTTGTAFALSRFLETLSVRAPYNSAESRDEFAPFRGCVHAILLLSAWGIVLHGLTSINFGK